MRARVLPSLPSRLAAIVGVALLSALPAAGRAEAPPAAPEPPPPAAVAPSGPAADGGNRTTGVVFGPGHAFTVQAPQGWQIEGKGEGNNGLAAVFYPLGSSFPEAPAVLYVNTSPRQRQRKLDDFVAEDIEGLRQGSPAVKVEKGKPIVTADGKRAEVRLITNDRWANSEAVAFLAEDSIFVTLVLTARSTGSFQEALPAFEALVRSYRFVTKDVKVSR